jgi:lysophospholipase L1-like esterase
MSSSIKLLSLGDCNTLGIGDCQGNAYPERFAHMLNAELCNCGFTMSSLREGENFFNDYYDERVKIITLQYGLVDSWETFKYAPYVLYYPDNIFRKIARKLTKKYKKICKKMGLNRRLGTAPVLSPEIFSRKLETIKSACRPDTTILLIETVPNQDTSRNPAIYQYNKLLKKAAENDQRCLFVPLYEHFDQNRMLYADKTHINASGHDYIANKLFESYQQRTSKHE